jgi:hypothetical protein
MIQLSEGMIGQEIVHPDSLVSFPRLDYVDYSDGRLLTQKPPIEWEI